MSEHRNDVEPSPSGEEGLREPVFLCGRVPESGPDQDHPKALFVTLNCPVQEHFIELGLFVLRGGVRVSG